MKFDHPILLLVFIIIVCIQFGSVKGETNTLTAYPDSISVISYIPMSEKIELELDMINTGDAAVTIQNISKFDLILKPENWRRR